MNKKITSLFTILFLFSVCGCNNDVSSSISSSIVDKPKNELEISLSKLKDNNFSIDYYDSYVLASSFIETTIYNGYNNLVIKTGKENLLCQYDYFDSVKVNITIDPKIYKQNYTNTTNIKNNTYTWNLDKTNCNDSQIILTLDKIDKSDITIDKPLEGNDKKSKTSDYTLYIFLGIILILMLIGYIMFKKMKEKNENIDLDD